ncbi:MAG: nuclear transport factor 2 family protein [Terriglobales bacterium]
MTLAVPKPVAAYFTAEAEKDAYAISRCFTDDGIVRDEGLDYRGRDAIRQWKAAADAEYNYVLAPLRARTEENKVTVRARLTGDFPGSPVELDHIFTLSNKEIASLEIR